MNNVIKNEDDFFVAQIADAKQVAIFLVNGNRLQGIITAADQHCLLVEGNGDPKASSLCLVMKTAIASVVASSNSQPSRPDVRVMRSALSPIRK